MNYLSIIGIVLAIMILVSTVLGIGGIWGWFKHDYTWQIFLTFLVVGAAICLASLVSHYFFRVG